MSMMLEVADIRMFVFADWQEVHNMVSIFTEQLRVKILLCFSVSWIPGTNLLINYYRTTTTILCPPPWTLSRTTGVSRYQKGKTRKVKPIWICHMQICTSPESPQTGNHTSIPSLSFFTGWMPFLPPNQQRQSTEFIVELKNKTASRFHPFL